MGMEICLFWKILSRMDEVPRKFKIMAMFRYQKVDPRELTGKMIYVWGAGLAGLKLSDALAERHLQLSGFIDNAPAKWGTTFKNVQVISPHTLLQHPALNELLLILALDQYESVLQQIEGYALGDILLFCNSFGEAFHSLQDSLLRRVEYELLGTRDLKMLDHLIREQRLLLYGDAKVKQDFSYVFSDYQTLDISSLGTFTPAEHDLLILCAQNKSSYLDELQRQGYRYDRNYIFAEDLFPLLDLHKMSGICSIPSVMMTRTTFAPMQDQFACMAAFKSLQISTGFTAHVCCPDWSDALGNLEHQTLAEIWHSVNARIFRLSLLNRTYCFCSAKRCVHLKPHPQPTLRRLEPPRPNSIPSRMEVNLDRTCNLFCTSCRSGIQVEKGERLKRIAAVKQRIIDSDWLNQVDNLCMAGQGEVCFSKVYRELLFDSSTKRHKIELRTNGILLDEAFFAKLQAKYEQISIIVSIDAATKATYQTLRRSHDQRAFDKLQLNLQHLSAKKAHGELAFFQINMCVQMLNLGEVLEFIRMGQRLGVDQVYLTPVRNWGTYTEEEFREVSIYTVDHSLKPEAASIFADPLLKLKGVRCVI